jgi:hypothetical protein
MWAEARCQLSPMGGWLRTGRRLEWHVAVVSLVCFFVFGGLLTRRAPSELRWFVWMYVGGFYLVFGVCALLLVRHLRRRGHLRQRDGSPDVADASPAETSVQVHFRKRIKIYLAAGAVTAVSATEQSNSVAFRQRFAATTGEIFLWNFAAFAVVILVAELVVWWKTHATNRP